MKCDEIQLEISALLDGNLAAGEAEKVRSHCRRCPSCRDFLKEQRELAPFLRSNDPGQDPPAHLWYQIRDRIETQASVGKATSSRHSWWNFLQIPRWVYPTGAAAALLYLSFLLIDFDGQPNQENYLAELEEFNLQVAGNPFLSEVGNAENPFLDMTAPQNPDNPFQSGAH